MNILNFRHIRAYDRDTQIPVTRPGPFGNPFVIGKDGDRDRVVRRFKTYFYDRMRQDVQFRKDVLKLEGKDLICWCAPERCHAEVIRDYLENRRKSLIGCGKSRKSAE